MELIKVLFPVYICIFLLTNVETRRVKIRPQPIQPAIQIEDENSDELSESQAIEDDNRPQSAIQYYNAQPRENLPLVSSDEEYNGYYGQPTPPVIRSKLHNSRPAAAPIRSTTLAPRTKDNNSSKPPPVQTIRNYNKVNDDGSFTFGYEAADGSFKEETRGTDCVVRGKYGYIDPDGNKREFTYVSGNPCDPNNPEGKENSAEDNSNENEENSNEPENVPQNYPSQRPVRPLRPIHTTTHAPTTVFQNTYSHHSLQPESEEEEPEPIQVLQPQQQRQRPIPTVQPLKPQYSSPLPSEVTIRQRPRITVNTTPSPPATVYRNQAVTITPRPTYRPVQVLQPQPPATTYRPALKHQQPAAVSYSKSTPRPTGFSSTPNSISSGSQRPVDFNAEFQKFQKQHNLPTTTTARTTTGQYRQQQQQQQQHIQQPQHGLPPTSNPIYESQLIYDPSSGQYDTALYQQLPQTDGEFQLNHRIQPYVHQIGNSGPPPQLVSLDQLQQVNPIYRRQPAPLPQFSQQIYEKEKENLQVLNSQQLFQQQQELQNQQLLQDRIEAAKKATQLHQQHRFKPSLQIQLEPEQFQSQVPQQQQQQQPGFYYIQPSGQIDSFLRGHNINF